MNIIVENAVNTITRFGPDSAESAEAMETLHLIAPTPSVSIFTPTEWPLPTFEGDLTYDNEWVRETEANLDSMTKMQLHNRIDDFIMENKDDPSRNIAALRNREDYLARNVNNSNPVFDPDDSGSNSILILYLVAVPNRELLYFEGTLERNVGFYSGQADAIEHHFISFPDEFREWYQNTINRCEEMRLSPPRFSLKVTDGLGHRIVEKEITDTDLESINMDNLIVKERIGIFITHDGSGEGYRGNVTVHGKFIVLNNFSHSNLYRGAMYGSTDNTPYLANLS